MFKYLMLISSIFVLSVINPVQSLLWLVCVFICASLVLIEMGAEFIAILLILVYIGAIAVLFLFVIMLLNIRIIELNLFYIKYKFIAIFFSFFFLLQILFILFCKNIDLFVDNNINILNFFWLNSLDFTSNIEVIGILLFEIFYYYFFFLSLILLVALLGTLVLLVPKNN